jgi:hypothetical protein
LLWAIADVFLFPFLVGRSGKKRRDASVLSTQFNLRTPLNLLSCNFPLLSSLPKEVLGERFEGN